MSYDLFNDLLMVSWPGHTNHIPSKAEDEIKQLRAELAAAQKQLQRSPKIRAESDALQAIVVAQEFLRRVTHWQDGKLDCHGATEALDVAYDAVDWIEHGIVEWRDAALKAQSELAVVQRQSDNFRLLYGEAMEQLSQRSNELAEARALLVKSALLLKEVITSHADPDDPNYNDCDVMDERCAWCVEAQAIIDAALKEQK